MRKACKILSKEETGVNKPLKKPTQLKKKKKVTQRPGMVARV
jgi:hypothetical protein